MGYRIFKIQVAIVAFLAGLAIGIDCAANLRLPVDYSDVTLSPVMGLRRLALSPHGRELDAELMWRGALWNGAASASLFWRKDPGHYATLPDDRGMAISWNRQF